jgi:hypothetical protein
MHTITSITSSATAATAKSGLDTMLPGLIFCVLVAMTTPVYGNT